ncbi:Cof-type HAD-IIB family hydrolase [Halalkalibacter urbisdiaboli]|uniref:Cof-type HAD-IIB family hydrolase n=1 Tax=Halalkalibacter urbisdiaboli TaxID=1960589 RepID=UPI000B44A873|nr:Cof-type HAD-IIB family hydrolase [Halalkalibacter urbisdiaboli]
MTYKMIVLDMDDTLLQDDHSISQRTIEALMSAQERGVKVVLASGRPSYAMHDYADQLKLADYGSYILSFNGAKIINCKTKEEIFGQSLPPETVHQLVDLSHQENVGIHTYVGDTIVTEKANEYSDVEAHLTGLPIVIADLKEAVTEPVVKVLMLEAPEHLIPVEEKLKQQLGEELSIMRSKPFFLEFMPAGVSKGTSLAHLIEQLGITREEVIAMGDSYNDLEMIEFAGLGIAMGNAPDDIKEKADYVTDTNKNDGVAKAVEEFVLQPVTE